MYRTVLLAFIFLGFSMSTFAQQKADSALVNQNKPVTSLSNKTTVAKTTVADSVPVVDTAPFMTPKKIGLLSAMVPGFGQFKNKQYWKVGIIAVGAAASVYFIYDNQRGYNDARTEQATKQSNKPSKFGNRYANYSKEQLSEEVDYYQKNLDLTYVLTGVGYALQIIDAVVFAHLKGFDISDDITLKWKPVLTPQGGPGFGLVMNF